MKTTVVPAQITTVEDRIAGNLTFTQLIILIIPLITGATVYVLIPPENHFTLTKGILIGLQFLIFGALAIRVRGKILVDWLIILLRFKYRPRIYLFTKNDLTAREILDARFVEDEKVAENEIKQEKKIKHSTTLEDQIKINQLLGNPSLEFRFGLGKKGGIDVSISTSED